MTFKALLEAFAETKDAESAEWMLDEMRDFEVIPHFVAVSRSFCIAVVATVLRLLRSCRLIF